MKGEVCLQDSVSTTRGEGEITLTHEKTVNAVVHTVHASLLPSPSTNPQTLIPNTALHTAAITAPPITKTPSRHASIPLYIPGNPSLF